MHRRTFLGGLAAALPPTLAAVQDTLPRDTGAADRLWDPTRAGRPIDPRGERDNAEEIKAIERRLRCTCGCNLDVYTCRTTDFTCGVSPEMHRRVLTLWEEGRGAEEIVSAFVAEHGEAILMAPPKQGFNLVGWWMPLTAVSVGLAGLLVFLRRHTRRAAAVRAEGGGGGGGGGGDSWVEGLDATPEELERLGRELKSDA